jgi:hypothetical protein
LKNIKKNTHFNLGGFLIAVLMLLAFGSKEAHYFVYHQHVEVKVCADTKKGEHHFHDQDYIHSDCTLCDFTFSFFELSLVQKLDLHQLQTLIPTRTFSYPSFFSFQFPAFTLLRGPPAFC